MPRRMAVETRRRTVSFLDGRREGSPYGRGEGARFLASETFRREMSRDGLRRGTAGRVIGEKHPEQKADLRRSVLRRTSESERKKQKKYRDMLFVWKILSPEELKPT